ncbi:MAG: hypothetical protein IH591_14520 [Bacteroidales bacterium]|nr:hypothetical protein [Bacteroidales bacterium]
MKSKTLSSGFESMHYLKLAVISVIVLTLLPQCAVKRPAMTTGIVDKVALMSTTINFRQQAGISGPAAVARGQFNNRADEINSLMSHYIDSLHHAVAYNLRTQLGCEVIYGEELHALPMFNNLKERYETAEALNKEDEHFPEVLISKGDFNFIIAETKSGIMNGGSTVFLTQDDLKSVIPALCEDLGIQHIAVAEFILTGFKQSLFFAPDTYVRYTLYLYNHLGELIATSYNNEATVKLFETDLTNSFRSMIISYLDKSELIELNSVFEKKR